MSATAQPATPAEGELEFATDQAIEACGGDARQAVKALLIANSFLESQLDALWAKVSRGYARGRLPPRRERKDETDV